MVEREDRGRILPIDLRDRTITGVGIRTARLPRECFSAKLEIIVDMENESEGAGKIEMLRPIGQDITEVSPLSSID
jgi:hypothetical protein